MSAAKVVEPEKHYKLAEAAAIAGMSESTLKRAISATSGKVLRAKRMPSRTGKARGVVIPASALAEFLASLDDA